MSIQTTFTVNFPANTKSASLTVNPDGEFTVALELYTRAQQALAQPAVAAEESAQRAIGSGYTIGERTSLNYIDGKSANTVVSETVQIARTEAGKKRVFRKIDSKLARQVRRTGAVLIRNDWRLSNEKKLRDALAEFGCTTAVELTFRTVSPNGNENRFGNVYAVAL